MIDRLLDRIPGWLGSRPNIALGLVLLVVLVILPMLGVPIPAAAELVGGNWMNGIGYLGASIAAGASVVNLHEGRKHRNTSMERLEAIHDHLTKPAPPRTGRNRKEPAP